jgi:alpha-glucosidase (family GH31 glycosyl hydrolase)
VPALATRVAALLAVLAVPAAARTVELDAGTLRARVTLDPWQLAFVDAVGRPVLTESAVRRLGVRTRTGWIGATRAGETVPPRRRTLRLSGQVPGLPRGFAIVLRVEAEGVIGLAAWLRERPREPVTAIGIGFEALPGERFLGFGERANGVDQRGTVVENHVADGPYQPEERALVARFVPPAGFRARDDATYYPVPWLLSTRGLGVLVDDLETSYFRLGTEMADVWSVEVVGAPDGEVPLGARAALRLRIFAGPRPADALRRFTARVGRQPRPAAPWVLGPWVQLGGALADRVAQLATLRAAGAPVSVVQTYTHYLPCGDHVARREEERALVRAMHAGGVAVTTYFNPMLCESYAPRFAEAVAAGALTRRADGAPYVYDYTGSTTFRVGQLDFTAPAGRALFARLAREALADGHDGWMEDFGEYTPLDAFTAAGLTGAAHHNAYPVAYHCAGWDVARAAGRPVVRFQRSGWTGAARCAQVVWNGDPSTDWGFDGLGSAVSGGLGMGLSGIALWGSDIGGFFALGERALTPELLARWVQLGAVSGVMRTQHNGFALPPKPRPQIYDDAQLANWKRYATLRTQLYPYLAAAVATYRRTGLPLMRHAALTHPDDPAAVARDDQFLLGPDLLAAPVLAPGATTRALYLPDGDWVDLWRSGRWDSAAGAFVLGPAVVLRGGRAVTLPAPPEELPLLVRAGAVVPLLPADVDTLAGYGDPAPGFVRLRDRADRLVLLALPRGTSTSAMFGEREALRSAERAAGWTLAVRGRRRRTYTLDASLATLDRPFTPCRVTWSGGEIVWSYDAGTAVLRARFAGRRGRLVVRPCP